MMPAAIASRLVRGGRRSGPNVIEPADRGRNAKERRQKFGATGPDQAGQADDFAGAQRKAERCAAGNVAVRRPLTVSNSLPGAWDVRDRNRETSRPIIRRIMFCRLFSSRESWPLNLPSRSTTTRSARSSTSRKPMGNVNNAYAARPQLANNLEQFVRFVLRKRRRGLVHDEDASVRAQRLGDFDELLLADRKRAHDRLWIDIEADHVEILPRLAIDGRPVDEAEAIGLAAEKNIGADREIVGQIEFLMDQRDAELERLRNRSELHRLAVDDDFAGRGRFDAGDNPHQRAFAGAVFADDREHFAAV